MEALEAAKHSLQGSVRTRVFITDKSYGNIRMQNKAATFFFTPICFTKAVIAAVMELKTLFFTLKLHGSTVTNGQNNFAPCVKSLCLFLYYYQSLDPFTCLICKFLRLCSHFLCSSPCSDLGVVPDK